MNVINKHLQKIILEYLQYELPYIDDLLNITYQINKTLDTIRCYPTGYHDEYDNYSICYYYKYYSISFGYNYCNHLSWYLRDWP